MYAAAAFERGGAECLLTDFPAEGLGWDALEQRLRLGPQRPQARVVPGLARRAAEHPDYDEKAEALIETARYAAF